MKKFCLGVVMMLTGAFLLLRNMSVTNFGFFRFGRISTSGILILLLIGFVVAGVATRKEIFVALSVLDVLLMFVSVIAGTRFVLRHMSALGFLSIIGLFAVGLGLVLSGLLGNRG